MTRTAEQSPKTNRVTFEVLGVRIDAVQISDVIAQVERWVRQRDRCRFIAVTGMHGVIEAQEDPTFKQILNAADLAVPDGISMVWLGRHHGHMLPKRVAGPNLMEALLAENRAAYRHFLYGGAPGVADQLSQVLRERFGALVVGTYSSPFRELTREEDKEVIALIESARPDILWVSLSTPKQELWMNEHRGKLNVPVMLGVGAAFDFLAQVKPRAPRWIGEHGFEWLFRLLTEPRRLWRRVLIKGSRFVFYVALEISGLRKFSRVRENFQLRGKDL